MDAVVKAIRGLADMVSTIFDFAMGFIEDLVYIVKLLGDFLFNIPLYFGWLPASAVSLIVSTFSIVVVYLIANRK